MKTFHFLTALVVLTFATPLASAYDPSPLQDFCVATDNTNGLFVNGKLCKNPKDVTANDFFYSGLNKPKTPIQPFGSVITPVDVSRLPGLNTLGLAVARVDYAPNGGQIPPHTHPRASEILYVAEGTLSVGFISSDPNHTLYTKALVPGDVFIFPIGLIHYQFNTGNTPAVVFSAFNSQNPGLITIPNNIFGSRPPINPEALARASQVPVAQVRELQAKFLAFPPLISS